MQTSGYTNRIIWCLQTPKAWTYQKKTESWILNMFVVVAFWQPPPPPGCYLTVLLRFWGSKSTFTALPLFEVWTWRGFEVFTTLLRFFTVGGGHLLPPNVQFRVSKYYQSHYHHQPGLAPRRTNQMLNVFFTNCIFHNKYILTNASICKKTNKN